MKNKNIQMINKLKKLKIKSHTFRELDFLGIKGFMDNENVLFITFESLDFIKENIKQRENQDGISFYYMDLVKKIYRKLTNNTIEDFIVYRHKTGLFIGNLIDFRIIIAPCKNESLEVF